MAIDFLFQTKPLGKTVRAFHDRAADKIVVFAGKDAPRVVELESDKVPSVAVALRELFAAMKEVSEAAKALDMPNDQRQKLLADIAGLIKREQP